MNSKLQLSGIVIILFFLGLLISCSKNEMLEVAEPDNIKFKIGGIENVFDAEYIPDNWNTYFTGNGGDQLSVAMINDVSTFVAAFNISAADLYNKHFPYTFDEHSDPYSDGYINFEFIDLNYPGDTTFSVTDSANFIGLNSHIFTFTIDKFISNYISGTFSGSIYTTTGKELKLDDGKFSIHLNEE